MVSITLQVTQEHSHSRWGERKSPVILTSSNGIPQGWLGLCQICRDRIKLHGGHFCERSVDGKYTKECRDKTIYNGDGTSIGESRSDKAAGLSDKALRT